MAFAVVTTLRDERSEARISVGATDVALLQNVQTEPGDHPAPCTLHAHARYRLMDTFTSLALYPRGKSPDTSSVVGRVTYIFGTVVSEKRYILLSGIDPDSCDVQRLVLSVY